MQTSVLSESALFFCFLFWIKVCFIVLSRFQGYKTLFMLTRLSMKFVLLKILKLLTISKSFLLNIAVCENFSANKYENANNCWHLHIY